MSMSLCIQIVQQIVNLQVNCNFSMIFQNILKFHDYLMTAKSVVRFFQVLSELDHDDLFRNHNRLLRMTQLFTITHKFSEHRIDSFWEDITK